MTVRLILDRKSRNSVSCQGAGAEALALSEPIKSKTQFCALFYTNGINAKGVTITQAQLAY